jgi:hypothetical protein
VSVMGLYCCSRGRGLTKQLNALNGTAL